MSDRQPSSDDLLEEARGWLEPSSPSSPGRSDTARPEGPRPADDRPEPKVPEALESIAPRRTRPARVWAEADPFQTAAGRSAPPHTEPSAPSAPVPHPPLSPYGEPPDPTSFPPTPPVRQDGGGPGRFARFVIRLVIVLVIAGGFAIYRIATRTETAPVDELTIGTCFQDPGVGLVGSIEPVDCDKAHDLEVFAKVQLPFGSGAPMPEDVELFDTAYDECLPSFERYTGERYLESEYYIDALVPDLHAWKAGDREAVCFLFLIDADSEIAPATGSARA